jgi:GNAT superfamily N-acetyltransferase
MIVTALHSDDREAWASLWRGYLDFYQITLPPTIYEAVWRRVLGDGPVHGLGLRDRVSGPPVGIVHYLFHPSAWTERDICYLQDLFVAPDRRGSGGARMLIAAGAAIARQHACSRLYWLTEQNNATARLLYDKIAKFNGFIRYDYPMT